MPIGTYFTVIGVEKFAAAARSAPTETEVQERRAMKEALLIVRTLALSLIHRDGRRRVSVRSRVTGSGIALEGRLHPTGVGQILEGGAKPHEEKPVHASVLAFAAGGRALGSGGVIYAKKVNHPGIQDKEFLKPALEVSEPFIQQRFDAAATRLAVFLEKA